MTESSKQPSDDKKTRKQSFGGWADAYNRYRPGYPPVVLDYLMSRLPERPRVADIGAGTGQLSRGLLESGCEVVAIEPDERMRALLTGTVGAEAVREGTAESIPLPDASVDAVVGGQMWHWVEPEVALPEIARVLKPGGMLAIIWNLRDDRVPWVAAMAEAVELADAYRWFEHHEKPDLGSAFSAAEAREFAHSQPTTAEDLLGLVGTFSAVALSPDAEATLAKIRALTVSHPDLTGRETFDIPYVCKVFTAYRQ